MVDRTQYQMVKDFHDKFRVPRATDPVIPPADIIESRWQKGEEEFAEYHDEIIDLYFNGPPQSEEEKRQAICRLVHEIADVVYVLYGTAASFGADMDNVFWAVHEANMTKSLVDGKIVKGDKFKPADSKIYSILFGERERE